ncbi:monovalent cation:proton antiporter-2 (CPA2) family protein [Magnetospirillum molischianum]|uniref:Glutathione-regulated potassium-efflux system protein kefB n=1 Tax=Magnetospirillum molischianum DSM 120 TaxID=1150626 RepID=H8FXR4_MAGML|nr:monovalent cation:proton antiporter-2 (CPA2) family protein [Magnetospirillum molischianum]CCG43152.1 Glutathione-regulated potassium-efflux system protein kefB [Magnetospirillum molischianum DSM 120]
MPVTDPQLVVLILLLGAVLVVPLFQRLGIPSVLGYLVAGIALGPYNPGPVSINAEITRPLAELGVVFLLFAIGIELPFSRLKTLRRLIFGLGVMQVILCGAAFFGLSMAFGLSSNAALVVGITLSFSSTATVLAILVERNEAVSHHGRIAIAVLILQDLAVVPLLVLLPLLASAPDRMASALGLAGIKAALAILAIYLVGRIILRPAYRYISVIRNAEVFTAANLLLVLAVGWFTAQAGMSMALGAFLAGLLVADSPYRHQVEADIEPFRGLLLGLFFMTVGLSIDLPYVADHLGRVVGITFGLVLVKAVLIALCGIAIGIGPMQSFRVGVLLAQTGEFAFVVFSRADELNLLERDQSQTLVAAVVLSMALTPALAGFGRAVTLLWRKKTARNMFPTAADEKSGHVVIAGYGRIGRAIARILSEHGIDYVALDLDIDRVAKARTVGLPVYYGDASQPGVLRSVGIEQARAAVITVNKPRTAERAVARIRQTVPDLIIIARAHDLTQKQILAAAGATAVVPETIEASLQLAGLVLRSTGMDVDTVEQTLRRQRQNVELPLGPVPLGDGISPPACPL